MLSSKKLNAVLDLMANEFPNAWCELTFTNTFELLIAVLLSARTTDKAVNKITPRLFKKYPTPEHFIAVDVEELMEDINTIGLYRNKAVHIQQCCQRLIDVYDGCVPDTFEDLTSLAGVGRKTANVVLSVGFNKPAIAVDTHVERVSKCLGAIHEDATPLEVEEMLMKKVPKTKWSQTHHLLIFWGRYRCTRSKRNHNCPACQALLKEVKKSKSDE
ncbi:endonuclease III [Carnobacteriaceae bacterium zg-C25]|nr:endonuclease III [Carnobacteriaceae bacterium zg-ZUI240]QTU82801.1 endonuclease III [Carnobacteriaceae bacterium zg-C25]